ncbi:cysteine desulfurase family protein [Sphingomonas sp. PAMC 26621]|uniref:cysteine desulfurase family protein n=1 Tax=Sphingomonas sp. PAMC 26621 TaxID=1112213 RepID=UPI00028810EB|nr:cysteine desulfurase family protein [Sphingomonas sp. PAMC 26621]
MTYLDYQATTPLAPESLDAMLPWLRDQHANPHSPHAAGRKAKAVVEHARAQLATLLPPHGRVAFTSGATEALNWAIKGTTGPIVTIATEHAAVLDTARASGRSVTILPVGSDGLVDRDVAEAAIVPGVGLVAAMLVNNEIGVVQPTLALGNMAQAAGARFLCDAVQGVGRIDLPAGADFVAISAHKIHGPKGIGALYVRDGVALDPFMHGGGQEALGRSGTLSPALCAGFGVAADLMAREYAAASAHIAGLWRLAVERLGDGWQINGSVEHRYPGNLNIRRDGLDGARLMSDLRDIAFSAGSACASGSGRSSHVLRAIGLSEAQARSSIRLGFGRYTDPTALTEAIDRIVVAADLQRMAA